MAEFIGKELIRNVSSNVLYKKIDGTEIAWRNLSISHADMVYFYLSTNPIIYIERGTEHYYFRECMKVLPKKEYVLQGVERFFLFINDNDYKRMGFVQKLPIQTNFAASLIESFKKYISGLCSQEHFINSMLNVDKAMKRMNYSIWSDAEKISADSIQKLGLTDFEEKYLDITICFLWQMRSYAGMRRNMYYVRDNEHSYFAAVRMMATKVIAEEMQLQDVVVCPQWCHLKVDDIELYGVLCNSADGIRALDEKISPSVKLQQKLTELHILDLICFQQDHGPNNYNICYSDNSVSVCAFDNDNPNTFFPIGRIDLCLAGCNSVFNKKGRMNRTYFSYELAEKIIQTDEKELCIRMKPFLNFVQRYFVILRLRKMKECVKKAGTGNALIRESEWTEEYLTEELTGKYGETYLTKLLNLAHS